MNFEAIFGIAVAIAAVSKLAEWVLRVRFRRQAMRGFRAMESRQVVVVDRGRR